MNDAPSVRTASYWAVVEQFVRQGAMFIVSLVLARLLSPQDFGLVALVLFFSNFGIALIQTGLQSALLRLPVTGRREESSIFWFCLIASTLFGVGLLFAAPSVGAWFGHAGIAPLMAAAAAQLVFAALGVVPTALLNRRFAIRAIAIAALVATAISGSIGVVAALNGLGAWAIALHLVINQALTSAILFATSGWRPILTFDPALLRKHLKFGNYISASSALDVLYSSGFAIVVGKFHGFVALGLYNRAQGTQQLPGNIIGAIIQRLAIPLFARHLDDGAKLRADLRSTIELAMLFNLPAMAFVASASSDILVFLFGEQWRAAAPILSLLAIGGAFVPLHVVNLQLLVAQGRSDSFFAVETGKKVIGIALVILGSFFGVIGLAVSQVAFNMIAFAINARAGGASVGFGPVRQMTILGREMAASAAIVGINLGAAAVVEGVMARLAFGGAGSAIVFALLLWRSADRLEIRKRMGAVEGQPV